MAKELKNKTKTVTKKGSKGVKGVLKEVKVFGGAKGDKAAKDAKGAVKAAKGKAAKGVAKVEIAVPKAERAGKRSTKRSKQARGRTWMEKMGRKRWLIGVAALILVVAGGIAAAVCFWEKEAPAEISQEAPAEPEPEPEPEPVGPAEGDEPLVPEKEIPDWSAYTVAANKPRYLTIAAIGLYNVPVIEVGVTNAGAMGAPSSNYVVGWYYRSAYPGRVGRWATVIDGHGGYLGDGIFKELPNLKGGEEIVIEMGDGRKFTYVVKEMVYKNKGKEADAYMKVADRPVDAETPTLTLITCTGAWIRAEQTYTQRLFVRAVLRE